MNQNIRLIEITKKNNKLLYKYSDESIKSFKVKENDNGTYIEDSRIYYILEYKSQIEERLVSGDFENCIVLILVDFKRFNFINNINCMNTIFSQSINFSYSKFNKSIYFSGTEFLKEVIFRSTVFNEKVYFNTASFISSFTLNDSTFQKEVNFNFIFFRENMYACNTSFKDNISFNQTIFNKSAVFSEAIFFKEVDFENATIESLELKKVNKNNEQDFILNLKYTKIENISYTDANINNALNRDTFLILKNLALKNNDQISGLNFYIQEMRQHKKEAKGFDRFLLNFEWGASYFGTKGYLPIFWILGLNFLFIFTFYLSNGQVIDHWIRHFIVSLNPTKTIEDIFIFNSTKIVESIVEKKYEDIWEMINFLKNILFASLIYQTIKSFRKFSRKL